MILTHKNFAVSDEMLIFQQVALVVSMSKSLAVGHISIFQTAPRHSEVP